eukprot:m.228427 g.228427  ORF g.228427 m.228427 type:complete len:1144 (+) comp17477_c0_seq1:140-3571(+)
MSAKTAAKPVSRPAAPSSSASSAKKVDVGAKFKALASAAVTAAVSGNSLEAPASPQLGDRGAGRAKVSRYVDPKVAARNSALNAMGGVKVDVFVRVRPKGEFDGDEPSVITADKEQGQIVLEDPAGYPAKYTYDKVYGQDTLQEEVYEDCVSPIIEQVCRGLSCAIFAYGQTGAGKTYTMRGDLSADLSKQGIIQRSVTHLFRRLQEHDYTDVKISGTFLEIYNEELEDLFIDKPRDTGKGPAPAAGKKAPAATAAPKLMLVDDPERGCVCAGLTEIPVNTLEEIMQALVEAEARCRFSETKMNKMSNRAHRIFTLIVNFKRYDNPVQATLTFVDLAGSEDISKSGAKGMTAREASHINKSLLTLGRVINALACNEKHIPYRDSKLTRLLSEALGGVCKTSFIACISPCASSQTETNSTLRYAERAMEALNISQLPRWKQDEIMIDGLTRRVQQLLDELELKDRIHYEEMTELKNDKIALTAENGELKRTVRHKERTIERLLRRKGQLKSGLNIVTQQREVLTSQREALQAELLETRKVRDGYLADRNNLQTVLQAVRSIRERLLKAHNETEAALTQDAQALKRTIEGAVVDIDDLHTEIQRKKGLSQHNEKVADNFKDRASSKLRGLVQAVSEFKVAQDEAFADAAALLADLKSTRQKETATIRADLARLAGNMTSMFADITKFGKDTDAATRAKLAKARDFSESSRDETEVALTKLKAQIAARLEEIRLHSATLDEGLAGWADKVKSRLGETLASSQQFSKDVLSSASALQAHLEGATTAQLAHLQEHSDALQKHLESERATVAAETERVFNDISAFVQRALADHATQAIRRTEKAVSGFCTETAAISDETREMVAHQVSEHGNLATRTRDWTAATQRSLDEGTRNNTAAHLTAAGLVKKIVGTSQTTDQESIQGTAAITALVTGQRDAALQMYRDSEAAAAAATSALEKLASKGTSDMQAEGERLREAATANGERFEKDASDLGEVCDGAHDKARKHIEAQTDDLFDTEADCVQYVMQEIKRDINQPIKKKEYTYPRKYAATAEYASLLTDVAPDWTREVAVRDGRAAAGQGTDYPGQKGADDVSGLLTTTKHKPLQPQDQTALDTAARESDGGEYSSDGEHEDDDAVGPNANGEAEVNL